MGIDGLFGWFTEEKVGFQEDFAPAGSVPNSAKALKGSACIRSTS